MIPILCMTLFVKSYLTGNNYGEREVTARLQIVLIRTPNMNYLTFFSESENQIMHIVVYIPSNRLLNPERIFIYEPIS